jgi:glycosyltransferase involved in cell wall biosynthesis
VELLAHRPALLHSPDFIPPAFGPQRRVITVHDLSFLYYPDYLTPASRRYYSGQIRWATQVADQVIADSHHTRQDIIERLGAEPERVTTIHLAAGPAFAGPLPPAEAAAILSRRALSPGFILFAGTIEPRKNIPTLLRAYWRLSDKHRQTPPLIIAGRKGWLYEPTLRLIGELGLAGKVLHLEDLADKELAALYQTAALLALPSHYEGFGLPILEAMSVGCPVICSNRASLPEVAGSAAVLLEPDDVEAWQDALARLLEDSALAGRLRQEGLAQAARFNWARTARETLAVYERALAGE